MPTYLGLKDHENRHPLKVIEKSQSPHLLFPLQIDSGIIHLCLIPISCQTKPLCCYMAGTPAQLQHHCKMTSQAVILFPKSNSGKQFQNHYFASQGPSPQTPSNLTYPVVLILFLQIMKTQLNYPELGRISFLPNSGNSA